jgi:transcription initiation factor TFIIIB Brf1 subunit/transcription initiation factor TFIIB
MQVGFSEIEMGNLYENSKAYVPKLLAQLPELTRILGEMGIGDRFPNTVNNYIDEFGKFFTRSDPKCIAAGAIYAVMKRSGILGFQSYIVDRTGVSGNTLRKIAKTIDDHFIQR